MYLILPRAVHPKICADGSTFVVGGFGSFTYRKCRVQNCSAALNDMVE